MKNEFLYWDTKSDRDRLVQSLRKGEVSLGTSDTVLGLMAHLSKDGFDKLNEIKGRGDQPAIILLPSIDTVSNFARFQLEKKLMNLLTSCWPGPLTVIFKAHETLPAWMKSKKGTVAVRVPHHQGLQEITLSLGGIFSTSANVHGKPVPKTIDDVEPEIIKKISYIITDKNAQISTVPSTIIDCSEPTIKIVREGSFSIAQLEKLYNNS